MSVPHTGHLVAEIRGDRYEFNGDVWTGPRPDQVAMLNASTDAAPKTHYTIEELARNVLGAIGQPGTIIEWTGDSWEDDIPDDAED